MERILSILGIPALIAVAYLISTNRRAVSWKTVGGGVLIQITFAFIVLSTAPGKAFFSVLSKVITKILGFTMEGSRFLFGPLVENTESFGFIFAFQVLPTIIYFSALMSVLYHLGIMQKLVQGMAWVMNKLMGVSGAESLSVAANVFIGQTEAPLVVRPYIPTMTESELMALMSGGFSTIAGAVLAAYVIMLGGDDPVLRLEFAKHLLAASVMSAPAAFVMAKIIVPETEVAKTSGTVKLAVDRTTRNVIDAAASGADDGLRLALNVGAMLLAFIALIALLNWPLSVVGGWIGIEELSLKMIFGWVFSPFAAVMGVPWRDCLEFGSLLGQKVAVNEFVAYMSLQEIIEAGTFTHRSTVIATYALCGFANFSSIAIQLGGIGGIAPSRRQDLARLGLRAMIAGALASWMTATIAGILV